MNCLFVCAFQLRYSYQRLFFRHRCVQRFFDLRLNANFMALLSESAAKMVLFRRHLAYKEVLSRDRWRG